MAYNKNHKFLLIVDDDEDYFHDFKDALSDVGVFFSFEISKELPKKDQVKNGEYDIVFLDLVMHDSTKDEIFNLCKEISNYVPVVVVSETEDKKILEKSIDYGSHAFIAKTNLNSKCLLHVISKALDRFQINSMSDKKIIEFRKIIKGVEDKYQVSTSAECKTCSHAECRLNESIHRLKLMA